MVSNGTFVRVHYAAGATNSRGAPCMSIDLKRKHIIRVATASILTSGQLILTYLQKQDCGLTGAGPVSWSVIDGRSRSKMEEGFQAWVFEERLQRIWAQAWYRRSSGEVFIMYHLPARASNCIACLQVSACTSPYSLGWATFLADRNCYKHFASTAHSVSQHWYERFVAAESSSMPQRRPTSPLGSSLEARACLTAQPETHTCRLL